MSKDPAFLFYPGDWLGGTMHLTFEEKGAYLELLVFQFHNGSFTESQAKQVLSKCNASVWQVLSTKFTKKGAHYFNQRLKDEIEKRKKFSESRRNNALSKKKVKKPRKAYAKHMENENENEDENINRSEVENAIEIPFDSASFKKWWGIWKDYKKEQFKFTYKGQTSEQAALKKLNELAGGNEAQAVKIIEQSIANSWKGFFDLKENGKSGSFNEEKEDQLRRVFGVPKV